MSPEWIKRWKLASEFGDLIIDKLGYKTSPNSGYCDPRIDNFSGGADLVDELIVDAADILPDGEDSLIVLGKLEGIRDHLRNLGAWMDDNYPLSSDTSAA